MENLTIIGTSHISKDSIKQIKDFVENEKPDIIAVELDKPRLQQLFSKEKDSISFSMIFRIGIGGFFFALIGRYAQQKLGQIVGVKPGSDMKTAINMAKKNKIQLALIDQNIQITLQRFSKAFNWKEKWNMVKDVFLAFFKRETVFKFDLRTVPSEKVIKNLLGEVEKKYPNLYKVLVSERNVVMAHNLTILQKRNPNKKILAVVGAGHLEGIKKILGQNSKLTNRYSYSYSINT